MAVDETMVARVARLARIGLREGEAAHLVSELNSILGWVDQLHGVDTGDADPMTTVIPVKAAWREDQVTDGDRQPEVLSNAPNASHGFFAVPKVIE